MKTRFIAITLVYLLAACNKCLTDCIPRYPVISFHYLSETGEDLLGGPGKKYNVSDFTFFSLDEMNSEILTELEIIEASQWRPAYISAYTRDEFSRKFLRVKGQVTDTLDMVFSRLNKNECCGESLVITQRSINGEITTDRNILTLMERN